MNLKYFGTDGIRGEVGGDPVNEGFFKRVGYAVGLYLRDEFPDTRLKVLIGRDTRGSGELLERAIIKGLSGFEGEVILLGIIPTPGLSYCTQLMGADMGIMLTASHNPASDNGVKLLDGDGRKLSIAVERRIEEMIESFGGGNEEKRVKIRKSPEGKEEYVNYMKRVLKERSLAGLKVVMDLANGAAYETSPEVFKYLGADLVLRGVMPDGTNINENVGSEFPEGLAEQVKQEGAQLGIAHDGDGDRLVICDEEGCILDGDQLLGVLALHALREGRLSHDKAVVTIQSNMGLDMALVDAGAEVVRVDVGDRNVLHKMRELECSFGGESSGHIIFSNYMQTGDALLAALKVFEVLLVTGMRLADLRKEIQLLPQLTLSLKVKEKLPLEELSSLSEVIGQYDQELEGRGRILVRYSGTEPKIRLLVEGGDLAKLKEIMHALRMAVEQDLEVS